MNGNKQKSIIFTSHLKNRIIMATMLWAIVLVCHTQSAFSIENRSISPVKIFDDQGKNVGLYSESHALVIGVSDYVNGWPKLPGVLSDIEAVSTVLEKHGFIVVKVIDPDKNQLEAAFEKFIRDFGGNVNNRLLFYFAGHGHTITPKYGGQALGYIVPKDAPNPTLGPKAQNEFKRIAMSMQRIEEYALNIDAKHVLFLFDSCFSGSLFAMSRAIPEYINYKTAKPVRQFITSGTADESVPDESIFRHQFIAAIDGEADVNNDGYITGSELGEFLQNKVVNYSKGSQHPQYGKIRNPALDKGDFVFLSRHHLSPHLESKRSEQVQTTARNDSLKENVVKDQSGDKDTWQFWQKKMNDQYAKAEYYDSNPDLTIKDKIGMWESFLTSFNNNNPNDMQDDLLRRKAEERLAYWKKENTRSSSAMADDSIWELPQIPLPSTLPKHDTVLISSRAKAKTPKQACAEARTDVARKFFENQKPDDDTYRTAVYQEHCNTVQRLPSGEVWVEVSIEFYRP